jgi:putative inorganic carbon (HCO3(-)) transporter
MKNSLRITSIFFVSLLCIFLLTTLNYSVARILLPSFNSFDIQRICELAILLLTTILLLINIEKTSPFITNVTSRLSFLIKFSLSIILVLGITSSLIAPLPSMALLEVALDSLLFYFALFVASQSIEWREIGDKVLIGIIYFAVVTYLGYFFYFFIKLQLHQPGTRLAQFPSFMNPRVFAEFQLWTLAFLSLGWQQGRWKKPLAFLSFIVLALWWSLAIFNGSKALWLAVGFAGLAVAFIFKKASIRFLATHLFAVASLVVLAILTAGAYIVLHHKNIDLNHFFLALYSIAGSFDGRTSLWIQALALIKAHPLLGIGPMHFAYYNINGEAAHPHNAILLTACEWGIPALLIVIWLVFHAVRQWLAFCRRQLANTTLEKPSQLNLPIAFTFTLIAGLVNMQLDSALLTPLSQIMMALTLGWMLGYYLRNTKENLLTTKSTLLSRLITTGVTIASCIVIVLVVTPQLSTLSEKEINWYMARQPDQNYVYFSPRFWLQGWLQ